ncbi:unnamed protein product [Paramecium primaurelia]|uniref:Uncharacterized protein n=1 Tax=Paramecium primaurelia TaxID=5886 RepID=A0A8S1KSB5_PARPR|nr:unnamed protein product [Paramecium primaurelia]
MKKLIIFTVFIVLVCGQQDLAEAFSQLSSSDPDRTKLNWPNLSQAISDLLCDVQNVRQIESDTNQQKSALLQKLIILHDRTISQIKVDLAKHKTKLNDQLTPYKNELDEALKYRAGILDQQKQDLKINDADFTKMKESAKLEMDDVSIALQSVDSMRKTVKELLQGGSGGNSFVEIKTSLEEFHAKITSLAKTDSPLLTLASSLQELLQLDFKDRKVLKDLEQLLDQFWMNTIDYRIELISQANRNQQLYEDRRQAILQDKDTTIELYNSKIEEYNTVFDEIQNIQTYIENRQKDLDDSANSQDFFKNIWGLNEGITNQVDKSLISKASAIQDALKQIGNGVSFQEK